MRFLTDQQMIAILPAEPALESLANEKFNRLLAAQDSTSREQLSRLSELTALGELHTAQVNLLDDPIAVLWFRRELNRLIVDTMVSVSAGRDTAQSFAVIWTALERIARDLGCSSVEGMTARAALARVYRAHGFSARGVLFRKSVAPEGEIFS